MSRREEQRQQYRFPVSNDDVTGSGAAQLNIEECFN